MCDAAFNPDELSLRGWCGDCESDFASYLTSKPGPVVDKDNPQLPLLVSS